MLQGKSIYIESSIFAADGSTALETWGTRPLSEEELNAILQWIDELPPDAIMISTASVKIFDETMPIANDSSPAKNQENAP